MKKFALEFLRRGLVACGLGPIVLAVLYLVLKQHGVETLTVDEVCLGIFSLTALSFIAGGMNAVYQMERLPLMLAILIHGGVLYAGYLAVYLLNGWLQQGLTPLLVFTAVFVIGYLVIWVIIYSVTKQKTAKLNQMLKKQQESAS
ncbi:MAG: DUF3021 domain-containing protein [bacterium]|nr:DUF3021 domain-containing protein [bacterium]